MRIRNPDNYKDKIDQKTSEVFTRLISLQYVNFCINLLLSQVKSSLVVTKPMAAVSTQRLVAFNQSIYFIFF